MRLKTLVLPLAAALGLITVRLEAATLFNYSFNQHILGWSTSVGTTSIGWDAADELGGEGSLKLTGISGTGTVSLQSPCVAIVAGTTVTYGGALKAIGGSGQARAVVQFFSSGTCSSSVGSQNQGLTAFFPSSTWNPVQGTAVAPAAATHARVRIQISITEEVPSAVYLDNAFLVTDTTCAGTPGTTCLNDQRFRLSATWTKPDGQRGAARIVKLTDDSAYLWFFKDTNIEVVAKVLDACSLNDRFWVFAAGLTNVEVNLRVTDTATGVTWESENPLGHAFEPIQDTAALATCPK